MDIYLIVAELQLPKGALEGWLHGDPDAKAKRAPSPAEVLDTAEGDVIVTVDGDHFSLRTFLIDGAYFGVKDPIEAAFARAAALGGKGQWYSGDHVSGTLGVLGKKPTKAKVHELPDAVAGWVMDATGLGARGLAAEASVPTRRARPAKKARAAKSAKTKTTKKSAAAPKRKQPAAKPMKPVARSKAAKPVARSKAAKPVARSKAAKPVARRAKKG